MSIENKDEEGNDINIPADDKADEVKTNGGSCPKNSELKAFEISDKFLQNMFKKVEEEEEEGTKVKVWKVWKVENSELPATLQVVRISKERHDSHAFRYIFRYCENIFIDF